VPPIPPAIAAPFSIVPTVAATAGPANPPVIATVTAAIAATANPPLIGFFFIQEPNFSINPAPSSFETCLAILVAAFLIFGFLITFTIFAGFVFLLSYMFFPALTNINTALVGASASVMAILFATVTYSPLMNIRLLLFGNVKLWHIALIFIVIDLFQLPMENTGGHLAHIGGAFFGYIYIRLLKNGTDISNWFTLIIDAFSSIFGSRKSKPFKKVHRTYKAPAEKRVSKIVTKDKVQQQIDEILDKISQSGYDSLSSEEKEFLFKAGKQ
jgi:hypothetical protein